MVTIIIRELAQQALYLRHRLSCGKHYLRHKGAKTEGDGVQETKQTNVNTNRMCVSITANGFATNAKGYADYRAINRGYQCTV